MSGELVTIQKKGEKQLRIHPDALAQHQKLGWKHVPDAPVAMVAEDLAGDKATEASGKTLSVKSKP